MEFWRFRLSNTRRLNIIVCQQTTRRRMVALQGGVSRNFYLRFASFFIVREGVGVSVHVIGRAVMDWCFGAFLFNFFCGIAWCLAIVQGGSGGVSAPICRIFGLQRLYFFVTVYELCGCFHTREFYLFRGGVSVFLPTFGARVVGHRACFSFFNIYHGINGRG